MSLYELLIGNFLSTYLIGLLPLYFAYTFSNEAPSKKKMLGCLMVYTTIFSIGISFITIKDIQTLHHIAPMTMLLVVVADNLLQFLTMCLIFSKTRRILMLLSVTLSSALFHFGEWFLVTLLEFVEPFFYKSELGEAFYLWLINFGVMVVTSFVLIYWMRRIKDSELIKELRRVSEHPQIVIALFLLEQVVIISSYFLYRELKGNPIWLISLFILLFILFLLFITKEIREYHQIEGFAKQLAEQESYTYYLEQIQKELRKTQHDYKNMLTAIYAYAQEDNSLAAKNYMEDNVAVTQKKTLQHLERLDALGEISSLELRKRFLDFLQTIDQTNDSISIDLPKEMMQETDIVNLQKILSLETDGKFELHEAEKTLTFYFQKTSLGELA